MDIVPGQIPTKVYKVNLANRQKDCGTGYCTPKQTAGLVYIAPVVVTRDGSRFAYSYYQVFSGAVCNFRIAVVQFRRPNSRGPEKSSGT